MRPCLITARTRRLTVALLLVLAALAASPATAAPDASRPANHCPYCHTTTVIRPGTPDPSEDIRVVQRLLQELGYYTGPLDGTYHRMTEAAVRRFQLDKDLTVDGIVGPATWQKCSELALYLESSLTEAAASRPRANAIILINVDTRRLYLHYGPVLIREYPIGAGKYSTPTPIGEFTITHKSANWGGGFGSRWMQLSVPWGLFGIHGTNQPNLVGGFVSHGCIRLRNQDVEELYTLVDRGTPVRIFGRIIEHTLVNGSRGSDVWLVQTLLRDLGYYQGKVDGVYGRGTERAVRAFEKANGLRVDGIVSEHEYLKLKLIWQEQTRPF
ncbi:MAG: peptidoglycan-binding protein [Bacillota bacterium]